MKAIVQDRYGNPEAVLGLQEIAKPAVKDGEALFAFTRLPYMWVIGSL